MMMDDFGSVYREELDAVAAKILSLECLTSTTVGFSAPPPDLARQQKN